MLFITIVCCIAGLLIGGIPFGYLIGLAILKDDIRNHGSGNIGATNVGRVIGWKWGSLVLVLDAIKGLAPVLLSRMYASEQLGEASATHVAVATGVAAIIGHMYPVYLRLRGGKGVATALGVVLILGPWPSVFALAAFVVVVALTRIVAVSSIAAAVTYAVSYFVMSGSSAWTVNQSSLTTFSIVVPTLIIWRHRSNIVRLINSGKPPLGPAGAS